MSDTFDPYYIWLGIPPEDQPPNHYRLLGVTLFENNREVIEAAANRQMAYMQEISGGDRARRRSTENSGRAFQGPRLLAQQCQEKNGLRCQTLQAGFDSLDHANANAIERINANRGGSHRPADATTAWEGRQGARTGNRHTHGRPARKACPSEQQRKKEENTWNSFHSSGSCHRGINYFWCHSF